MMNAVRIMSSLRERKSLRRVHVNALTSYRDSAANTGIKGQIVANSNSEINT
jgi:hypothetical protein